MSTAWTGTSSTGMPMDLQVGINLPVVTGVPQGYTADQWASQMGYGFDGGKYQLDWSTPDIYNENQVTGQLTSSGANYGGIDYRSLADWQKYMTQESQWVDRGGSSVVDSVDTFDWNKWRADNPNAQIWKGNFGGNEGDAFWLQDANGNLLGKPTAVGNPDRSFMRDAAVMIAAGYFGGNYLSDAYAAGSGAGEISGFDMAGDAAVGSGNNITTAGAQFGGGGTYQAGYTADQFNPEGYSGREPSNPDFANANGGGELPSNTTTTSTGKPMAATDWINALTGLYGAYNNYQSQHDARDAANRALDLTGMAANRQADLADQQWSYYKDTLAPLMEQYMQQSNTDSAAVSADAARMRAGMLADAEHYRGRRAIGEGLQDQFINEMGQQTSEDATNRLIGGMRTDMMGNYSLMQQANQRNQSRMGINPGSAAAMALAQQAMDDTALNMTGGANNIRSSQRALRLSNLKTANDMMSGASSSITGANSGGVAAGGLGLQAGMNGMNGINMASGMNNSAAQTAGNLWGASGTSGVNGFNAMNSYAQLVNNGMFTTLAGMGYYNLMGK